MRIDRKRNVSKMKLSFNDIIDKHSGGIGIAVATGPSLIPHLGTIVELSNTDEYVTISVNEFDTMFPNLNVSYRVVANATLTVRDEVARFNRNLKTTLIYADSVDLTPKQMVSETLIVDYLPYDQRHFDGKHCTWGRGVGGRSGCCNHIEDGRLTIQEELKKYCKSDMMYGAGDTVALHMLTLTILIGCNPIYIVGVDLDYSKGYADGVSQNRDSFAPFIDRILNDFEIIKKSSEKIGVEIYSLCESSPINNIFKYVETIE
jgi:hypothetical protein